MLQQGCNHVVTAMLQPCDNVCLCMYWAYTYATQEEIDYPTAHRTMCVSNRDAPIIIGLAIKN